MILTSKTFATCRKSSRKSTGSRLALLSLAVLATIALTPPGRASEFPAVIPLSSLDGTIGFRLDGIDPDDASGWPVASAGDVNGDGFADLILGVPAADLEAGKSYVVLGKAGGFAAAIDLATLNGITGFRLDGISIDDYSGRSVASAGDVNGDGFADVIVGAVGADTGGASFAGETYVVFGKAGGFAAAIDLATLNGITGFRLDGISIDDYSGRSVAAAGDVNGDGFADVIIGAYGADPAGGSSSGESYVVFGKAGGFAAAIDLATLNGTNGFRLDGIDPFDRSGWSVAAAGDVNGDGFADLIIGAPNADAGGDSDAGETYVVLGKATGFAAAIDLATLNGSNGFRLDGIDASDLSGRSVAAAGDVNGDGFADLIIGAPYADPGGGSNSGESYVAFGKAGGFAAAIDLATLNGSNGFRLDGIDAFDVSGYSVASAGDFNGDGFADIIIGALYADPGGDSNAGESYVVFGRAPTGPVTRVGAAASQYISGGAFADTLRGAGGNDALEGLGGGDGLFGGTNSDTASYLHAGGAVKAYLATPASNTGEAAGDSYTAIENLTGSQFADRLTGNSLANRLTGAKGADALNGGDGPDIFAYTRLDDSPAGAGRDRIAGFNAGTDVTFVDRIDLSAIDARTGPGNQAFTFGPFNGTKGRLRAGLAGGATIVEGDVDGDNAADFQIVLLNFTTLANLTGIDFIR